MDSLSPKMHTLRKFDAALDALRAQLPPGRLMPDADLARYHNNCLGVERRIVAAIQPESEAEIIEIVRIANQYRMPLYTISTGHNWGYGTAVPAVDDCVILDLSRMSAIRDMDAELGLVTVEPGVTQQQLLDYLRAHNLDFYVPTTGAGPTASIVGNALERGFGMTPEEDHFRAVSSVRAVQADGSIYQSCFAEAGSPYAGVWKWGIGPYLDGLFSQGNVGIVTALQIALAPRAEHTEAFLFTLKDDSDLEPLLRASRTLFTDMRGVIGSIKILNKVQYESMAGVSQKGRSPAGDFAWMGIGVFRSRKTMISPVRKEIRHFLGGLSSRLLFINDARNAFLKKWFQRIPGKMGRALSSQLIPAEYLMDLMNGVPRSNALRLAYQHIAMPDSGPSDPVGDGAGIMWYAPVIPMKIKTLFDMTAVFKEVLGRHGFPIAITYSVVNEKCIIGVIPLVYKRPEEVERARRCFQELWERGNALGCPPYRINVEAMSQLTNPEHSVHWSSVAKIKAALDPHHILSPGRYSPL